MRKLSFYVLIAFIYFFQLVGCGKSETTILSNEENNYVPIQISNEQYAEETVYNYINLRASFIENKPTKEVFDENFKFYPSRSFTSDEMLESEKSYVKKRCESSALEQLQSFDMNLKETVVKDQEYIYDVVERILVLYPSSESAVIEQKSWQFYVIVDDDGIYFNGLSFISSKTLKYSELDEEEKENIKIDKIVKDKLTNYFMDRIKATSDDGVHVSFEDLNLYLFPESLAIKNERAFVSAQLDMNVVRTFIECDISVESVDVNNYRAKVSLTQNILQHDDSVTTETTYWFVDVNISTDGILITNIVSDKG